jgi:hypothetical protein
MPINVGLKSMLLAIQLILRCFELLPAELRRQMRAMGMTRTQFQFAGTLLAAGFTLAPAALAEDTNDALIAKVDKRVEDWQPTKEERRLDEIAWAKDLRDALRLAKDNARPVFLFTYSGCAEREHAMALQRC